MAKKIAGFDLVRNIGRAFPDVEESTAWGAPALKLRGKLMACVPSHSSAESGSLVVCIDRNDRAALLSEAPEIYYVTDHYVGHDSVLVRLSRITPGALRDILGMAHKFVGAKARKSRPAKRSRRS